MAKPEPEPEEKPKPPLAPAPEKAPPAGSVEFNENWSPMPIPFKMP